MNESRIAEIAGGVIERYGPALDALDDSPQGRERLLKRIEELTERAERAEGLAELGAAWAEAEAALPIGEYDDETDHPSLVVETHLYIGPDHVEARAYLTPGYSDCVRAEGPTPAAALRALVKSLSRDEETADPIAADPIADALEREYRYGREQQSLSRDTL